PNVVEGPAASINASYGAYVGVNLQVGDQIVIGAEGDFSVYDATYDAVEIDTYDFATSDHKAQVSVRVGYLVNPDTLLYARAGYGLMHINPDSFYSFPGTESDYVQTVSAGIGVEAMVSPNALLRLEGLYTTALEEYRFNDNTGAGGYYVKPNSVEARVGAAFMF
ncbi:MAG: porin family protein, partial [Alphaproteobacteria bacterium]